MLRTTRIVVISILLSLTALSACTPRRVGEAMNRADSLMTSAPDSALALLDAIDPATLRTDAARARHALLLSQALDKNYVDVTDDSLISIADDYYARTSDTRSQMLSLFYHGRVAYNAKDYPRALVLFTRSLDLARTLDDPFWSARNAGEISSLYQKTYRNAEELKYAVMADSLYGLTGQQAFKDYAKLCLASAYINNNLFEHSKQSAIELIDSITGKNGNQYLADSYLILAKSYCYLNEYDKAIGIYEKLDSTNNLNYSTNAIYHFGNACLQTGKTDKARRIYNLMPDKSSAEALMLLTETAENEGDYRLAYESTRKYLNMNDSVLVSSLNQNFNKALSEHHQYERHILEMELEKTKIWRGLVITALLLVMAIMSFFISKKLRAHRLEMEKNISFAEELKKTIIFRNEELDAANRNIRELFASRFAEIDSLCRTLFESSSRNRKLISEKVDRLIGDMSSNPKKIAELQSIADRAYDNIVAEFKTDLPDIKTPDYLLFLYTLLGFSTNSIALLLNEDKIESVYNRKARLKRRIRESGIADPEKYIKLLS